MLWRRHSKYDQVAGRLHQNIILSVVGSMAHRYTAISLSIRLDSMVSCEMAPRSTFEHVTFVDIYQLRLATVRF